MRVLGGAGQGQASPETLDRAVQAEQDASVRAKVEHIFRIVKCQFGYRKARYQVLAKNAAQVFSADGLANLCQVRRALLAAAGHNTKSGIILVWDGTKRK